MFETPETKGESSGMGMWVGILVVIVVLVGGVVFYMTSKSGTNQPGSSTASAAAAAPASGELKPDPVHDLRIVSNKMDKDYTGTTAQWSVEVRNLSQVYTYSNIAYETTYVAADGNVLASNKSTIPSFSLGPGESQSTSFRDALFPTGTALYRLKITDATAVK